MTIQIKGDATVNTTGTAQTPATPEPIQLEQPELLQEDILQEYVAHTTAKPEQVKQYPNVPVIDEDEDELVTYERSLAPRRTDAALADMAFERAGGIKHKMYEYDPNKVITDVQARMPATEEGSGYIASAVAGATTDVVQDVANAAIDVAEMLDKYTVGSELDLSSVRTKFSEELFPRSQNIGPNILRDIINFAVPYGVLSKATKGIAAATTAQKLAKATALGGVVDFTVTEGDTMLGQLAKSYPAQFGWIPEAIINKEDDSTIIKRFRNVAEGLMLGGALEAATVAFKFGLKQFRAINTKKLEQAIQDPSIPLQYPEVAEYASRNMELPDITLTATKEPPVAEIAKDIPEGMTFEEGIRQNIQDTLIPAKGAADVQEDIVAIAESIGTGSTELPLEQLDEIVRRTFGDSAIPEKLGSTTIPPRVTKTVAGKQQVRLEGTVIEKLAQEGKLYQPTTIDEMFAKAKKVTIEELKSLDPTKPITTEQLIASQMYSEQMSKISVKLAAKYKENPSTENAVNLFRAWTEATNAGELYNTAVAEKAVGLRAQKEIVESSVSVTNKKQSDLLKAMYLDDSFKDAKGVHELADVILEGSGISTADLGTPVKNLTPDEAKNIANAIEKQGKKDADKLRKTKTKNTRAANKLKTLADDVEKKARSKAAKIKKDKKIEVDELGEEIYIDKKKLDDTVKKVGELGVMPVLNAIRNNGLISASLSTNIVGNMISVGVKLGDTAFGRVISKITGSDAVMEGELAAMASGVFNSFGQHLQAAAKSLKTGKTSFGASKIHATQFSNPDSPFLIKGLDFLMTGALTKGLQVPDEFFKSMAYTMQMNAGLVRTANKLRMPQENFKEFVKVMTEDLNYMVSTGKSKEYKEMFGAGYNQLLHIRDTLQVEASQMAKHLTFMEELTGASGHLASAINNPVTRIIAPFITTGINVQKMALAHTPFEYLYNANLRSGDKAARDAWLGRMSFATLAVGTMAAMFKTTGRKPTDPDALALWNATNKQEYSIEIGDKQVAMSSLGPLELPLKMVADFKQIFGELQDSPQDLFHAEGLVGAMTATVANLFTPHFIKIGLGDLLTAVNENDTSAIESSLTTIASQYTVPWGSAIKSISSEIKGDYDVHGYKGDHTGVYGVWEQYLNKVKAMTGVTGDMIHVRNIFGEPLLRPEATGTRLINPFATTDVDESPIAKEILRLYPHYSSIKEPIDDTQGQMYELNRISRQIAFPMKKGRGYVKLDAKEWDKLQAMCGGYSLDDREQAIYERTMRASTLRGALNELIDTNRYKDSPDVVKKAYIQQTIQKAYETGTSLFISNTENYEKLEPRIKQKAEQIQQLFRQ